MRIILFTIAIVCLSPVALAAEDENIAIVRGMITAVNDRRLDLLEDYVAQDVVRHSAATPEVNVTSLDEFRTFLEADISAVPDSVQEVDLIFANDDYVGVVARYIGTQTGAMGPFPPSGRSVEIPFIGILRIENSKIAEIWVEWDNLGPLVQLGHIPAPAAAE